MIFKARTLLLSLTLLAAPLAAQAGNGSDAVIGSIIGGATGAVIGNNLGGRDGAIVGGAIGAAAGITIATEGRRHDDYRRREVYGREVRRSYDDHDDHHDDDRYDRRYERNDRYDRRHDRYGNAVVVESPRYHYRGNEFVYGVPPRYDRGGYYQPYQGRDVVVVQRYDHHRGYRGNRHHRHHHDHHCRH